MGWEKGASVNTLLLRRPATNAYFGNKLRTTVGSKAVATASSAGHDLDGTSVCRSTILTAKE
jgi:hypothetical protein